MKEINTTKSIAITILIIFATGILSINNREINPSIITIEKGMSLNSVSNLLLENNVIVNQNIFKLKVVSRGLASKIPTGKFLIEGKISDAILIDLIFNSLPGGSFTALIFVLIIIFLLGFILDFIEICYVIVPLVAPPLLMMGFDPVWLAILFAINLQTSFLTPPFGFSLFYLRGVADESIQTKEIYKGVVPFILIQIIILFTVMLFPVLII